MRRILLLSLLVFTSVSLYSQSKTRPMVSGEYDRSSLSIILIEHTDSYDTQVRNAFNSIDRGEKFDLNEIEYKYMEANWTRRVDENAIGTRRSQILSALNGQGYGKQIVSYWFNRRPDGTMDADRVMYRGHYNATDMDRIKAEATKIGLSSLADKGFGLVSNSYVLVVDYVNIEKEEKDKKVNWKATAEGHLFQIRYDEDTEFAVNESWIYDTDPDEIRAEKIRKYNDLKIDLKAITSVSATGTGEDPNGLAKAVRGAYSSLIPKLENRVESWNVASAISGVKPIRAKIGTKEDVKNAKRFFVYEHRADRQGNVYSKKKGIVRATSVANNRGVTTGDTRPSEFYQIAGGHIEEGMVLQQKNDLGLGLGLGYRVGAMTGVDISLDMLLHIATSGNSQYFMMDFTTAGYGVRKYFTNHNVSGYRNADIPKVLNVYDFTLGYGYGVRLTRHFELVPHVKVGFETFSVNDDDNHTLLSSSSSDDDSFLDETAWLGRFGLKANINVKYPLQFFAGLDYSVLFGKGDLYKGYEEYLKTMDKERKGVGFVVGVKYTF